MGKLQTAVTLPKRILLQGWGPDQDGQDINGEYVYGKFTPPQIGQERSGYIRQNAYLAYIFQTTNGWVHYSDDTGWGNSSTNPNVLPYTGWNIGDGEGPAGSITILENISAKNNKISIKKQNLGGGKIIASKLSSYSLSISNIAFGTVSFPGDENVRCVITFTVPDLIRSYIISYQVEVVDKLTENADLPTFSIFTSNLAISNQLAEVPCFLALRIRGVGRQPNSFTAWSPIFTYGPIGAGCE